MQHGPSTKPRRADTARPFAAGRLELSILGRCSERSIRLPTCPASTCPAYDPATSGVCPIELRAGVSEARLLPASCLVVVSIERQMFSDTQ
jgi:hypothetical protein